MLSRSFLVMMLLRCCICVSAQDNNNEKVTLLAANTPLSAIMRNIEKQTHRRFNYSETEVNTSEKVNVSYNEAPLNTVLGQLFTSKGITWKYIDNGIYLRKEFPQPLKDSSVLASGAMITGYITDEKSLPLIGATVKVDNTNKGAVTDVNGRFQLNNVPPDAVMVISFTGYTEERVILKKQTHISIKLKPVISKLDETVVIGYGTTTQRYSTGSVSKVSGKEIGQQPVANPLSALQGAMPGVFITNGQGLPGTNMQIQIRGMNSIVTNPGTDGGNPLFIVDGVPFSGVPMNFFSPSLAGANDYLSPFNSINPGDIESVEVLKDADATAIYGARGANGVVLITTKKGKPGKTKLDVNVYTGTEKATHLVKTLNTEQYLALRKQAFANDNVTPTPANAPELLVYNQQQYTDFQKLLIGNTPNVTNAQINLSGGNNNTRFLLGANYRNEGTVFPGGFTYHRGGAHLNVEHNSVDNRLNVSATVNYTADRNNNISQTLSTTFFPNYPLYDSTGKLTWSGRYGNPLALLNQTSTSRTNSLISSAVLRYTIIPGLKIQANLGYNYNTFNSVLTYPLSALDPKGVNPINKATYGTNSTATYIIEPQANYTRDIADGELEALIGGTWQYATANGWTIRGQNYSNDALLKNLASAGTVLRPNSLYSEYKYISFFSRLNYNWKKKYIASATFRRDGSSRFGPANQFGNFGSGALAWIFSNEHFIANALPFLSYGKLRASYGIVGNDKIADYGYLSTYVPINSYQTVNGLIPVRIANPDYSWEVNRKLETALELGFLNDRILLTAAWFKNRSNNQLVGYPLPSQTGFTSYQFNLPAIVQNTGEEFTLNTVNIRSKRFSWASAFNISFTDNKLVSFPNLSSSSYSQSLVEGQSISIVKGFHFTQIDPKSGIPLFSTASGGNTTTPTALSDYVVMGKTIPDFFGGLSNTLSYNGIQLNFLFQFVKQQGYEPAWWPGATRFTPIDALNHWEKSGDISNNPVPSTTNTNNDAGKAANAYGNSDRFWSDASYIRLKNVMLSYDLPRIWMDKIKFTQVRVYIQGQNLWTITNYKGSDPEITSRSYVIPTLKTICAGLQVSL